MTVRERLDRAADPLVTELKTALQVLSETDVATLERHLAGTLDATSHRLDAWITSLATRRLAELRAAQPTGLSVGGYAWLENLRPATPGPAAASVPDEPGPLVTIPDDAGFIHAPSLNQASAAALLRNAHLAHGGDRNSPYAIELTSARVRLARQLFEGVRQGQPIGALLGYTFERKLHDAGLDDLVDDFRKLAPLPGAATPTGVRRLVVDGLALSTKWRADPASVLSVMSASDARRPTAQKILDALETAVDAAADAVNAEGAFQMVRGNLARAAASLDAISSGQAPPPNLGFVRTPRTGTGVTHRVAMVLSAAAPTNPAGWATRTTSPRAQADPALDAWAGRLLGPATDVGARVEELGPDGEVIATHVVPLTELGLTPIDLVWATGGADGAPQEIVQRVLDAALHAAGGPVPTASLRVDLGRAGPGRSLGDLVELATRAQRLLAGSRPMDGSDLQPPHADPVRGLDLDELTRRVRAAERALARARTALTTALTDGTDLRAPMLALAAFGVPGAVPHRAARRHRRGPSWPRRPAVWRRRRPPRRPRHRPTRRPGATSSLPACARCSGRASWRSRGSPQPTLPTSRRPSPTPTRSGVTTRWPRTPGCSAWSGCVRRWPGWDGRFARPRCSAARRCSTCRSRRCRTLPGSDGSASRSSTEAPSPTAACRWCSRGLLPSSLASSAACSSTSGPSWCPAATRPPASPSSTTHRTTPQHKRSCSPYLR